MIHELLRQEASGPLSELTEDLVLARAEKLLGKSDESDEFQFMYGAYTAAVEWHGQEEHFGGVSMEMHLLVVMASRMDPEVGSLDPTPLTRDLAILSLHDVLEDTFIHPDTIRELFGDDVADGVLALSRVVRAEDVLLTTNEYFTGLRKQSDEIKTLKVIDRICNLNNVTRMLASQHINPLVIDDARLYMDETVRYCLNLAEHHPYLYAKLTEAYNLALNKCRAY